MSLMCFSTLSFKSSPKSVVQLLTILEKGVVLSRSFALLLSLLVLVDLSSLSFFLVWHSYYIWFSISFVILLVSELVHLVLLLLLMIVVVVAVVDSVVFDGDVGGSGAYGTGGGVG